MSKSSIEVRTCDRCGSRHELREPADQFAWVELIARQVNGQFRIGAFDQKTPADLCPGCVKHLAVWWSGKQQ